MGTARFREAFELLSAGKNDAGAVALQDFASRYPTHPSAGFAAVRLADLLLAGGKKPEAEQWLQKSLSLKLAPELRVRALLGLAELQEAARKFDPLLTTLALAEQAVRGQPASALRVAVWGGRIAFQLNRFEECLRFLKAVPEAAEGAAAEDAALLRASACLSLSRFADAAEAYRRAAQIRPASEALLLAAKASLDAGSPEAAARDSRRFLVTASGRSDVWKGQVLLGRSLLRSGHLDAGRSALESAGILFASTPAPAFAALELSDLRLASGDLAGAEAVLSPALASGEAEAIRGARYRQADLRFRRGEAPAARSGWAELATGSDDLASRSRLALARSAPAPSREAALRALAGTGIDLPVMRARWALAAHLASEAGGSRKAEARMLLSGVPDGIPHAGKMEWLLEESRVHLALGDHAVAVTALRALLASDPPPVLQSEAEALLGCALIGSPTTAMEGETALLRVVAGSVNRPGADEAFLALTAHLKQTMRTAAAESLERKFRPVVEPVRSLEQRFADADALLAARKAPEALAAFRAIEALPPAAGAGGRLQEGLLRSYLALKRHPEALGMAEALWSGAPSGLQSSALALRVSGYFEGAELLGDAEKWLLRAISGPGERTQNPATRADLWRRAAEFQLRRGDSGAAIDSLTQGLKDSAAGAPAALLLQLRAKALESAGVLTAAAADLERAARLLPDGNGTPLLVRASELRTALGDRPGGGNAQSEAEAVISLTRKRLQKVVALLTVGDLERALDLEEHTVLGFAWTLYRSTLGKSALVGGESRVKALLFAEYRAGQGDIAGAAALLKELGAPRGSSEEGRRRWIEQGIQSPAAKPEELLRAAAGAGNGVDPDFEARMRLRAGEAWMAMGDTVRAQREWNLVVLRFGSSLPAALCRVRLQKLAPPPMAPVSASSSAPRSDKK